MPCEFGKLSISKETKIDILVTPAVTILIGVLIAEAVGPAVSAFMTGFGNVIMSATEMQTSFNGRDCRSISRYSSNTSNK